MLIAYWPIVVKGKAQTAYNDGHNVDYIQLQFYKINILYFTAFSRRSSISEL